MPCFRSFHFSIDLCLNATSFFSNTLLYIFSDITCKGGDLSVEDANGHVKTTFLEDGFFDYMNKVVSDDFFQYVSLKLKITTSVNVTVLSKLG